MIGKKRLKSYSVKQLGPMGSIYRLYSSFEIKDPVDPSKVVADVYLSKKGPYMNAQVQGNYMRPPTQDEIERLRKIADETGVRLLNPQNTSKYPKII